MKAVLRRALRQSTVRDLTIIAVAALLLTLPFLNQALHVDDREIVEFAKTQAASPLQFYLQDYYYGRTFDVFVASHPPLVYSMVALSIWLSGGVSELATHASLLVFPIIAGISMYSLGRRFTGNPLVAALLLLVSVIFLLISHELAADPPGAALWLAAIASYIWGVDRGDRRLLALSAVWLTLATLTLYQSVSLIPLLFVYALWNRRLSWKTALPLAAPAVTYAAFYLFLLASSGQPPVTTYRAGVSVGWQYLDVKGRIMLAYIGVGAVFTPALIVALLRRKADALAGGAIVAVALLAGVLTPFVNGSITGLQALLLAPMLAAGVLVVFQCLRGIAAGLVRWKKGPGDAADNLFLALWILGVLFYSYIILPYANVTHLLPLIPPVVLLFVRSAERFRRAWLRNGLLAGSLALGALCFSLPASIAEYRHADAYRSMAQQVKAEHGDDGRKVWYAGEFDFRYYMEREGFSDLVTFTQVREGDIIVRATTCSETGSNHVFIPPPPPEAATEFDRVYIEDSFPVRTRNPWAGTDLYSEFMGPLPIGLSRAPLEEFIFYEVKRQE